MAVGRELSHNLPQPRSTGPTRNVSRLVWLVMSLVMPAEAEEKQQRVIDDVLTPVRTVT